jgi:type II secretory pathway component PulM
MTAWWSARTERERLLLASAALIVSVALLAQVMAMLLQWRAEAAHRMSAAETGYRLVTQAAMQTRRAAPADQSSPPRAALTQAAGAAGVPLSFVNARPDGAVDAHAGPVAPERLYGMLSELAGRYDIHVTSADVARAGDDTNQIRAQLSLSR